MLRPRIIPCLLIHRGGLVKSVAFKDYRYIGDPINAVRIFNEKEADELMVLDIDASVRGVEPDYKMISRLAAECRMPLCYGGGITAADQAKRIVRLGVEKISLSNAAVLDPPLVGRVSDEVGRQSVVVTLDVRRRKGLKSRSFELSSLNSTRMHSMSPLDVVRTMQDAGAGELVINAIHRDGMMQGYDLDLAAQMRSLTEIPLTLLGGAGSLADISALLDRCGVVGAAAGSAFVYKGSYRAVLISYPDREAKKRLYDAAASSGQASNASTPRDGNI